MLCVTGTLEPMVATTHPDSWPGNPLSWDAWENHFMSYDVLWSFPLSIKLFKLKLCRLPNLCLSLPSWLPVQWEREEKFHCAIYREEQVEDTFNTRPCNLHFVPFLYRGKRQDSIWRGFRCLSSETEMCTDIFLSTIKILVM